MLSIVCGWRAPALSIGIGAFELAQEPFTNFDWTESNFDDTVKAAATTSDRYIREYMGKLAAGAERQMANPDAFFP